MLSILPAMAQDSGKGKFPDTPAVSQPKFDYKPTPAETELIHLSHHWMDVALKEKDEKRLREIMAPEFTLQIWDASHAPQTLEGWLDTLKNRLNEIDFKYSGINARIFGDVAVVYSRFWWKGAFDGKPFSDSGFLADVWVKRNGKWQVIARRSAPYQQIQEALALGENAKQ